MDKPVNVNMPRDFVALAQGTGRHPVFAGARVILSSTLYVTSDGKMPLGPEWTVNVHYDIAGDPQKDSVLAGGVFKSLKAAADFLRTGDNTHSYIQFRSPSDARKIAYKEEAADAQPA